MDKGKKNAQIRNWIKEKTLSLRSVISRGKGKYGNVLLQFRFRFYIEVKDVKAVEVFTNNKIKKKAPQLSAPLK